MDDPIVKGLLVAANDPQQLVALVHDAMAELERSICRDLADRLTFAFNTRLRQPEELYIRTLYAIFLATPEELPHVLSGDMPNGLSAYYRRVRDTIFEGRGDWEAELAGASFGSFTIFDTLNDGAHVSFNSILTARGLKKSPEHLVSVERYAAHIQSHLTKLKYVHGMLKAGRSKKDAIGGLVSMHRPASYWEEQQRRLKDDLGTNQEITK